MLFIDSLNRGGQLVSDWSLAQVHIEIHASCLPVLVDLAEDGADESEGGGFVGKECGDAWVALSVDAPDTPPIDGFIGDSKSYGTKVGVWLMPDNQRDGTLEDFLETLIVAEDPLIDHASSSTDSAKEDHQAPFRLPDRKKAIIHAWLAWQEEPGLPYGTAIRAKFFSSDSEVSQVFVAWFRRLYDI